MSDEQRGDLGPGEWEMTSADLTAHDGEHGELPDDAEQPQQSHHDAETAEDTASGGAPD